MKKVKVSLIAALLTALSNFAHAQALDVKQKAGEVWGYIQTGTLLFALIATVVGIVVVYNAKSSSNPDEFKKKLMNWIYGVLFLYVAFGLISALKAYMQSSMNVSF